MSLIYAVLLLLIALTSCEKGLFEGSDADGTVTLRVSFATREGNNTRVLSSSNENTVNSINVLVFDLSGNLIGSGYSGSISGSPYVLNVNTHTGTGCTVYAIANLPSQSLLVGVNTISGLNTLSTSVSLTDANTNSQILEGSQSGVSITQSGANLSIAMSHICTKQTFNVTATNGITITGYQLCNVPQGSFITDSTHVPGGTTYGSPGQVTLSASSANFSYYTYQNPAGTNSASNSEKNRNVNNIPTGGTPSYLLISAKTSSWHSVYRIYLGGINATGTTDYTNYNIYRNRNYTYTIAINGSGANDTRVTYTSDVAPTPGQYYFSDGTWGTLADHATATVHPIGVIFSNQTSAIDNKHGWTHGYAMALTNANTNYPTTKTCIWSSANNAENGISYQDNIAGQTYTYTDHGTQLYTVFTMNKDGYSENQVIVKKGTLGYSSSTYPAIYYALNYGTSVESGTTAYAAPSGSSGWYLPSIGQWYDIYVKLGGMPAVPVDNFYGYCRWYNNNYISICINALNSYLNAITTYKSSKGYSYGTPDLFSNNDMPYGNNGIYGSTTPGGAAEFYWSSTEYNSSEIDYAGLYDPTYNIVYLGNDNNNNKINYYFRVRPVIAF